MKASNKEKLIRLCYALSSFFPKSEKVWVFGAWSGHNYSDNSKYLFEYVNQNTTDVNAIWITRNRSVKTEVKKKGYKCYTRFSIPGIYYALRAGKAFETSGNEDISPFINDKKTTVFMLWHGIGVKALNWKDANFGEHCEKFQNDYFPATSELYNDVLTKLMNVDKTRFNITGYARNDTFITKPKNETMEELRLQYPDHRLVIYMPTHRLFGKAGNKHINFDEFSRLNMMLRERKIILVYKPHYHELQFFLNYEKEFSNIIMAKESKWADPYAYLHYFDMLISDYSSCIYDFICSDKPVVLFPYDLEQYKNSDAGLLDIYWTIPVGPMCYTWDEVISAIDALTDNDSWKEKRQKCRKTFHMYNDGQNCRRLFEYASIVGGNK